MRKTGYVVLSLIVVVALATDCCAKKCYPVCPDYEWPMDRLIVMTLNTSNVVVRCKMEFA